MSSIPADKNFILNLVKEQINKKADSTKASAWAGMFGDNSVEEPPVKVEPEIPAQPQKSQVKRDIPKPKVDKETESLFDSALIYLESGFENFKTNLNSILYDNTREQAVDNIETNDKEIEYIKDFFSLFSEVSYKGSKYSKAFRNSWAIEDPGTYSLQDSVSEKLTKWYKQNRQKFIKKMMDTKDSEERKEIVKDYSDDFLSTFDYYGLRIEKGARRLTINEEEASVINNYCLAQRNFISNWRAQWHGRAPCILDCFVFNFRFVWDLNSSGGQLNLNSIPRVAKFVVNKGGFGGALDTQKDIYFVNILRKHPQFRKKWIGFCYNMTFDPSGKFGLNYWTTKAEAMQDKSQYGEMDEYASLIVGGIGDVAKWVAAERAFVKIVTVAYRAFQVARTAAAVGTAAAAAPAAASGPPGWLGFAVSLAAVGVLTAGEYLLGWFSIKDEVKEKIDSMINTLRKVQKLAGDQNSKQEDFDDAASDYKKEAINLVREIHETMLEALQKDVKSIKNRMSQKQSILKSLTRVNEIVVKMSNELVFKKESVDVSDIQKVIERLEKLSRQISSQDGTHAEWDNKVKKDINLGSEIESAEDLVKEEVLLMEYDFESAPSPAEPAPETGSSDSDSSSTGTGKQSPNSSSSTGLKNIISDSNYNKWANIIEKQYMTKMHTDKKPLNKSEADYSLANAQRIDKNDAQKQKNKDKLSKKEKYVDVYRHLDDSDSGNLNGQASAFIDWWEGAASTLGKIIKDPNEVAEYTFLHQAWAQCPNGLKSTGKYNGNSFTHKNIGRDVEAYCAIGLCHSLCNTRFYYTNGLNSVPIGFGGADRPVEKQFYDLSRVEITENGNISLIDMGPAKVQKLRSLVDSQKLSGNAKQELYDVVDKVSKALQAERVNVIKGSDEDKALYNSLKAFNILAKVYYNNDFDKFSIAENLLRIDDKLTGYMIAAANKLSKISAREQNSDVHKKALSKVREAGAYKIMVFQAFMSL